MSNELTIRPATRKGVKPLIDLFSPSGCGKTYSSLLLARGLVGPAGKIVLVDSESGRGNHFADEIPGGYDVLELREPFSPERYANALRIAEESGAAVVIFDSMSHEWEGNGGVQDAAVEISQGRAHKWNKAWDGIVQFGDWKQPKMEHTKFLLRMTQSPLPIICCLRAKAKSHQVKGTPEMAEAGIIERNNIGKNVVVKDKFASPIQAEDFIFEATCHFEILPDHSVRVTKSGPPSLASVLPNGRPITIQDGEAIARWCAGGAAQVGAGTKADAPEWVRICQADAKLAATVKRLKLGSNACQGMWDKTKDGNGLLSREEQFRAMVKETGGE